MINEVPVLEVRNWSWHFMLGSMFTKMPFKALNDIWYSIRRGEVLSSAGESGSDKFTVARLIASPMEPTSGEILLNGVDLLKSQPRRASPGTRRQGP